MTSRHRDLLGPSNAEQNSHFVISKMRPFGDAFYLRKLEGFVHFNTNWSAFMPMVDDILNTFFGKGSVFTRPLNDFSRKLLDAMLLFFAPDGPFINALYDHYTGYSSSFPVSIADISELYLSLSEISSEQIPYFYRTRIERSTQIEHNPVISLSILEYYLYRLCATGVLARVSSKATNIHTLTRDTPYSLLITKYFVALRPPRSRLHGSVAVLPARSRKQSPPPPNVLSKLLLKDQHKADAETLNSRPFPEIAVAPFLTGCLPRTVADLFVMLAADVWFARSLPISIGEQMYAPFETLRAVVQERLDFKFEEAYERTMSRTTTATGQKGAQEQQGQSGFNNGGAADPPASKKAAPATYYRSLAYTENATTRITKEEVSFLTNVLDLALLFARYVCSPAAGVELGYLDSYASLSSVKKSQELARYAETLKAKRFKGDSQAPQKGFFLPSSFIVLSSGCVSPFYIVTENARECLTAAYIAEGQDPTTPPMADVQEDFASTCRGSVFSSSHAPLPYSEMLEMHVLPVFYSFLRCVFQAEPPSRKIFLNIILCRIYVELLSLNPARLYDASSTDSSVYGDILLARQQNDGSAARAALLQHLQICSVAVRAVFFYPLLHELSLYTIPRMLSQINDHLQTYPMRPYGSLTSLMNVSDNYAFSYYRSFMYLSALGCIVKAFNSPMIKATLACMCDVLVTVDPLSMPLHPLTFATPFSRAVTLYNRCEPCLVDFTKANNFASYMLANVKPNNTASLLNNLLLTKSALALVTEDGLPLFQSNPSLTGLGYTSYAGLLIQHAYKNRDFDAQKSHHRDSIMVYQILQRSLQAINDNFSVILSAYGHMTSRSLQHRHCFFTGGVTRLEALLLHALLGNSVGRMRALSQEAMEFVSLSSLCNILGCTTANDIVTMCSDKPEKSRSARTLMMGAADIADRPSDILTSSEYREFRIRSTEESWAKWIIGEFRIKVRRSIHRFVSMLNGMFYNRKLGTPRTVRLRTQQRLDDSDYDYPDGILERSMVKKFSVQDLGLPVSPMVEEHLRQMEHSSNYEFVEILLGLFSNFLTFVINCIITVIVTGLCKIGLMQMPASVYDLEINLRPLANVNVVNCCLVFALTLAFVLMYESVRAA